MSNGLHALPNEAHRELWKHETATALLSFVEDGDSQLLITDDYGTEWNVDREEIRELRDALTSWLDKTEEAHTL